MKTYSKFFLISIFFVSTVLAASDPRDRYRRDQNGNMIMNASYIPGYGQGGYSESRADEISELYAIRNRMAFLLELAEKYSEIIEQSNKQK